MKILIICRVMFLALIPVAIAAGKWLERINAQFEEAENRENE